VFDDINDAHADGPTGRSTVNEGSQSTMAARLAIARTCTKFRKCNASYCPAVGGKHLEGESVCHYLRESVKVGGQARIGAVLPTALANTVAREGLRLLTSTGGLQIALQRASKTGSRMELMKLAASMRESRHD